MVTDRVGDFIVRLQNAAMSGKETVSVPHSAHLAAIAAKLKSLGYIKTITVDEKDAPKKALLVTLAQDGRGRAVLRGVKRVSKPGRRLYLQHTEANRVKGGTGARIVSTSAGVLSDAEARKAKVGGENLFEIW
jgi:small subunit ribosomal protein S8